MLAFIARPSGGQGARGNPGDDLARADVAGDDGAGADERALADADAAEDDAPEPREAPRSTTRREQLQSSAVCSSPSSVVARGRLSLMNMHAVPDEDLVRDLDARRR